MTQPKPTTTATATPAPTAVAPEPKADRKLNPDLHLNLSSVISAVNRVRGLLIFAALAASLFYAASNLARYFDVSPDSEYLAAEKKKAEASVAKIDLKAVEAVKALSGSTTPTPSTDIGKSDPFSP